jgi:hypothetical protein
MSILLIIVFIYRAWDNCRRQPYCTHCSTNTSPPTLLYKQSSYTLYIAQRAAPQRNSPLLYTLAKIISLREPSHQTPNPSLPNEPFGFRRQ